jgi:hypothetical protein
MLTIITLARHLADDGSVKIIRNIESLLALTTNQVKRTKVSVIYTTVVLMWIGTFISQGGNIV